jgi:SsrA-binding protein
MLLAENKKAKFDYQILEKFEVGLGLSGDLVKAVRGRKITLASAFVIFQRNQLQIIGLAYLDKKFQVPILVSQKELKTIKSSISQKQISCVVLNIHTKSRWIKADIAIVKGKSVGDKRAVIKQRDISREIKKGLL